MTSGESTPQMADQETPSPGATAASSSTVTATRESTPSESDTSASSASGAASPSTRPVPSPPQPKRTLSLADPNLRTCFICLLDSNENPDAKWVNPCPCTLEAHEECMLKWVASMEAEGNVSARRGAGRGGKGSGGLRCPACKGAIQVFEPFDPVLWLRDRVHRVYSRASPFVLLTAVTGFGIAGSGAYGILAMSVFAGSNPTLRWLGVHTLILPAEGQSRLVPGFKAFGKLWLLNLIGPGLMLNQLIPGIDNYLLLPVSAVCALTMLARDNTPQWPPSPAWAMACMPGLGLCYSNLYYTFFGVFERRLNNILRGRDADGPPAQPEAAQEGQQGQQGQQGQAQNPQDGQLQRRQRGQRAEREHNIGLGVALYRLAGAVFNLFTGDDHHHGDGDEDEDANGGREVIQEDFQLDVGLDNEGRLQFEVIREERGGGDDEDADNDDGDDLDLADEEAVHNVVEEALQRADAEAAAEANEVPEPVNGDDRPAAEQNPEAPAQAADNDQPAAQENANEPQPQQQQQQQEQQNQANNRRQRQVDGGTGGPFSSIINGVVSALLKPAVAFGMGELLRVTLPRHWSQPRAKGLLMQPRVNGLLSEQWGRSLAGGLLYVVVRDVVCLYFKYRRAQLRRSRRVRNVERHRPGAGRAEVAAP